MDGGLEGPCMAKAKINVFPLNGDHYHNYCMDHCKKLGGHSPSVRSEKEWENMLKEVKAVSPDPSKLPAWIWLSATEGDIGQNLESPFQLGKLNHWPEGTEAKEGVWRDHSTGEQIENYTKPWITSNGDKDVGETYNCISFLTTSPEVRSWLEW